MTDSPVTQPPTDASRAVLILGREPAALLGFVEAVLFLVVAGLSYYGVIKVDVDLLMVSAMGLVSAAVGLYTAVATKDTLLGALTGFVKAALSFALFFGWDLPLELQAAILVAQLERLEEHTAIREENAAFLDSELSKIPGIRVPERSDAVPDWRRRNRPSRSCCGRRAHRHRCPGRLPTRYHWGTVPLV